MQLFNYSQLRKRDKKVYSVAGTQISSTGVSVSFLKVVAPLAFATTLIGILICFIVGKNFFNPLGPDFNSTFVLMSIGTGISAGLAGWYVKIQHYRLYEYLLAYLRPKKTYHTANYKNKEFKKNKVIVKSVVRNDL